MFPQQPHPPVCTEPFRHLLRRWRLRRGVSQRMLGEMVGFRGGNRIHDYESGIALPRNLTIVEYLADALCYSEAERHRLIAAYRCSLLAAYGLTPPVCAVCRNAGNRPR